MAFPATFKDIQDSVILKARLDPTLDRNSVKDWINRAYSQVCVEAEANVATSTMTLTPGSASYTLSSTIARVKQMQLTPAGSTQFNAPLVLTTLDEILGRRQAGGNTTTANSPSQPTHYTLLGINDLELWPTPAAADVITIYYAAYPSALSVDGAFPVIEEPYASTLLEYGALIHAGDFKGDPATADWQNLYDAWMAKYMQHLEVKRGKIPGQFHQWGDGWSITSGA